MVAAVTTASGYLNASLPFPDGSVVVRSVEIEVTPNGLNVSTNIFQMCPVFNGETIIDGYIWMDAMAATSTCDVGDGAQVDRYIDGDVLPVLGGIARWGSGLAGDTEVAAFNFTYTADDTIDIVNGTVTTGVAGTYGMRILVTRGL